MTASSPWVQCGKAPGKVEGGPSHDELHSHPSTPSRDTASQWIWWGPHFLVSAASQGSVFSPLPCQAGTITQDPIMQCKHLEFLILFLLGSVIWSLSPPPVLVTLLFEEERKKQHWLLHGWGFIEPSYWVGCEPMSHPGEAVSFLGCLRVPVVIINCLSVLWFEFTKPLNWIFIHPFLFFELRVMSLKTLLNKPLKSVYCLTI